VLTSEVRGCTRCGLRAGCKRPVPGFGLSTAPLFLVGQSPGAKEDEANVPFVGPSGKELRTGLESYGVSWRDDVYRTHAIKCHPAGNRKGTKAERDACAPWLDAELSLWEPGDSPHLIVAVGEDAAKTLWGKARSFSDLRAAKDLDYLGHPARAILHPSQVLRNGGLRPTFESELESIGVFLGRHEARPPYWEKYIGFEDFGGGDDYAVTGSPVIGLDTEFRRDNSMIAYSFSWAAGQACVGTPDMPTALEYLDWLVYGSSKELVIHSAQADVPVISQACRRPISSWPWARTRDTAVSAYVLRMPVGLKDLTLFRLGIKMIRFEDIAGIGPDAADKLALVPFEELKRYAGGDADFARRHWVDYFGPLFS
jgi:uracil-DNA glycosylase family 4